MQPVYESLTQFFRILLGDYTPITYVVDGATVVAAGAAGVDWSYLVRAGAFLLVVYSAFRLIGLIFK